jgi:hypothetical protein
VEKRNLKTKESLVEPVIERATEVIGNRSVFDPRLKKQPGTADQKRVRDLK